MKYFFIFLSFYSILSATTIPECYSIQLASYMKPFSKISSYPSECTTIHFKKYDAVRCNCLQEKEEAKQSLQKYKKAYPSAIVVKTYKFRFSTHTKKQLPLKKEKKQKEKWVFLQDLFQSYTLTTNNGSTIVNQQQDLQKNLLQKHSELQKSYADQSNFYGLSLAGKYEQYINQNYRFRDYTDYEYDLKLQFNVFKNGLFEHIQQKKIVQKKEEISYLQNISQLLKNSYDERLLLINNLTNHLNYIYFTRLTQLYTKVFHLKMQDFNNSLTTQIDLDTIKQLLNRARSSAIIYEKYKKIKNTKHIFALFQNIENLQLQKKYILQYSKDSNPDILLQQKRMELLNTTPSYIEQSTFNIYGHRRVVDEMGWYNTVGIATEIPLNFEQNEHKKVIELEKESQEITKKSFHKITLIKLQALFENFETTQKLIKIDNNDILFLQQTLKKYQLIQENMIPNLRYNPSDKILQTSQKIIDLQFQSTLKKVKLLNILSNIAYLSNISDITYLIKGKK